jgi:hypothetical protein
LASNKTLIQLRIVNAAVAWWWAVLDRSEACAFESILYGINYLQKRVRRPRREFNQTLDLARLQEADEAVTRDEFPSDPLAAQVQDLSH